THILELTPDGVRDFAGSYQEYLEKFGDDYLNREQPLSTTIAQTATPESVTQELSYDKRKKMQREISKLKKQATRFESLVEETELKISAIEAKFSIEDFFQQTSADEVQKLQIEKSELNDQLSKNLRQWETSSQNLESLEERFGA
ncbi:MAG TPA: ABC-F family ATPase, partial [Deltaproteobacteria bacterium]|nr:ABC-F family ATPase [Deltaproteobacteria bacterium]